MRVLVVFDRNRGVAQYINSLEWRLGHLWVCLKVGKINRDESILARLHRHYYDSGAFVRALMREKPEIVHLNPSLSLHSLLSCTFFLIVSKLFQKKVLLFIHGWQPSVATLADRYSTLPFRAFFELADAIVVLSKSFRQSLRHWGVACPIFIETTVVRDECLVGFDLVEKLSLLPHKKNWKILFLAEIVRDKGIYEVLEATRLLQQRHSNIELIIAGDGPDLAGVKQRVRDTGMPGVIFMGYVLGPAKRQVFEDSDIYCLPTYSEGLPTSVLEAMSYGLPVVTTAVGGLQDLFEKSSFGFLTPPHSLYKKSQSLISEGPEQWVDSVLSP
jgi:glycosyltransferase involved in cell wall biosynthesis